jgi:hypothetical protein
MKLIRNCITLVLLLTMQQASAQIYPIQATTQLVPPYAVYLPDYATGINNQLRVLLLNKDVTQPDYKVKLVMGIELNGSLIMRTSDTYAPGPITLQPNIPFSVEGLELAPYMNSANIDFIGYSRQDYEQKKGLPEGAYRICFTAYDYYRPDRVQVSNHGCSFYYLTKNDPPFVNMPACGVFITPVQDENENLIDRSGRWLAYTLGIPWDNAEKAQWYAQVEGVITDIFDGAVVKQLAKEQLYKAGMDYATARHFDWDAAYGTAWAALVYGELTKDEFIYWSRDRVKLGSTSYNINPVPVTGALGDADVATDVDLQPYEISGVPGNTNINFMWTPRHTSSPNSTLSTRYKIELYEVRPKVENGQLPAMANNAVLTGQPVFTDETTLTAYTYGPDKPLLIDGLQYAWRIKAFDANGRDWFKNNGYSEVCYFTFGGVYNPAQNVPGMEEINTFSAQAETERRGLGQWQQTGGYTGYRVRYRRKNGSGTWFEVDTDSLRAKLYDLEPSTAYQAQVQGKLGQYYGPFSPVKEFTTPAPTPPPGCGLPIEYSTGLNTEPLQLALPFMIIKCGKFEMLLDSVEQAGGPGFYSGSGRIFNIPFLGLLQLVGAAMGNQNSGFGTGLKVTFNNLFINKDREVTQGLIYAVSRSLEEWEADFGQFYGEDKEGKQRTKNREEFSWLDSSAVLLPFDKVIKDVTYDNATGTVTITDENGNTSTYPLKPEEKGHDVIIEGKDGNQWVIRKDGTVVAVPPPGGLYPGMNRQVSSEEKNLLKTALQKLKGEYDSLSAGITAGYGAARQARKTNTDNIARGFAGSNFTENPNNTENGDMVFLGEAEADDTYITADIQLDQQYKAAERRLNKRRLVKLFVKAVDTNAELEMVARMLRVNNATLNDFIKQGKAAGKTEGYMVDEIKKALSGYIDNALELKGY